MVEIIYWIVGGLLVVASLGALLRLTLGPTVLDRTVAVDLLTSVAIALTALVLVWWRRGDLSALLVLFALTGFFSSVAVARFIGRESRVERRIVSREEALLREKQQMEEAARQSALESASGTDFELEDTEGAGKDTL